MAKTKVSAQTKAAAELAAARRIMNDEREARHFFYSKMRPKNIALAATYNNMFSLDLTEDRGVYGRRLAEIPKFQR